MIDLISRKSSDADLDSHRLQSVLDSISNELTMPFLERRAKSKSHKKTPLEELNYVIQEITEKERELQAAVGIARMLLERNDDFSKKIKDVRTKKHFYKESLRELKEDNKSMKNEIILAEEKYQQVNSALITSEEQQIILVAEYKRLLQEKKTSQGSSSPDKIDNHESEITELINKHKAQYEFMLSKK